MKLQLYLNDSLYNEMHLPDISERIDASELSWEEAIRYREEIIQAHKEDFKGIFWSRICKAKKWEIFLIVESNINKVAQLEFYQL